MRNRVVASAGLVGIVCSLIALPLRADTVVPKRAFATPARRALMPSAGGRHGAIRYVAGGAVGCSADDATAGRYFIGANNSSFPSYAGGDLSGVVGGTSDEACDDESVIAGGYENVIGNGNDGANRAFIGAGYENGISGQLSFIGAGTENGASNRDSFVGAGTYGSAGGESSFVGAGGYEYLAGNGNAQPGTDNIAGATDSFVGAGDLNQITGNGDGSFIGAGGYTWAMNGGLYVGNQIGGVDSFIGAGDQNYVTSNNAFIGAGTLNSAVSSATYSVVTGGYQNTTSGADSFIGAGAQNSVSSSATYGVVAGGYENTLTGQKASLGGGEANKVAGSFAVVPGGYHDEALGNESFAAGSQAEAKYAGSFVWSDYASSEKPQTDSAINEFVARASGGVYFFSNAASSAGVHLAAGSGTWSSLSDRDAKTNIVPLDDASILAKIASLPISAWQYKTEHGVRHAGPMAQDFYAAFGLGEDDRHITAIDEDGVALAAIKALRADEKRKDADIAALRSELRHLEATVAQRNR